MELRTVRGASNVLQKPVDRREECSKFEMKMHTLEIISSEFHAYFHF
jgi:hypothetical protein